MMKPYRDGSPSPLRRPTPTMASGRIQRWALTLGAYSYTIQYRKEKRTLMLIH